MCGKRSMAKQPHTPTGEMTEVNFIILNTAAAHEGPWRMKRNGFRACTEDNSFAGPSDLQHLTAGRAASLLPISLFGRTGISPCNCVIFNLCRHLLESLWPFALSIKQSQPKSYIPLILFFRTCHLLTELHEFKEHFSESCI